MKNENKDKIRNDKISRSFLLVLLLTFIGSYGTFKYLKETSTGSIIRSVKYYEVIIPSNEEVKIDPTYDDAMVQSLVKVYRNSDIETMRPKVLNGTLIAFIISLTLGILIYRKKSFLGFIILVSIVMQSCVDKPKVKRMAFDIDYTNDEFTLINYYFYDENGFVTKINSQRSFETGYSWRNSDHYYYSNGKLDSIITEMREHPRSGKHYYIRDSLGRVITDHFLIRDGEELIPYMLADINYLGETDLPSSFKMTNLENGNDVFQVYKWVDGNCTEITTTGPYGDVQYTEIKYDNHPNPYKSLNTTAEYRYKYLSKNNQLNNMAYTIRIYYLYDSTGYPTAVYYKNDIREDDELLYVISMDDY